MNWSAIIIIAVLFGVLFMWSLYKNYKNADAVDKPKLVKIYAGIAVISIVLFVGIKLFVPSQPVEFINEQKDFQNQFTEDLLNNSELE